MPRTPRLALLRTLTTAATSVLLLVVTALPALAAAAGTKPDPEQNPYLVGSLGQLLTVFVVGVVVSIIAWVLMPAKGAAADADEHH